MNEMMEAKSRQFENDERRKRRKVDDLLRYKFPPFLFSPFLLFSFCPKSGESQKDKVSNPRYNTMDMMVCVIAKKPDCCGVFAIRRKKRNM
jgi:hypothetical protein